MKTTGRRAGGVVLAAAGLMLTLLAFVSSPASAAPNPNNECNGAFNGIPDGSLAIAGTPPAGNTDGDTSLEIDVSWDTADWAGQDLDKILNCVQVNGALVDSLSTIEKPTTNDGTQEFTIDVSDLEPGDEVCARVRLSGQPAGNNTSTQKSNVLCWTISEKGTPPPPADTYDITVTKNVVNGAGGESFGFTVDCDPFELDADNVAGSGVTFTDGAANFSLGDDGTRTVVGLPDGASCEVAETTPAGAQWTTTINGAASATRTTVVAITVNGTAGDRVAAFENTRVIPTITDTGTPNTPAPAVVAGVQVTRDPSPAPAPAAKAAVQGTQLAATGMSPGLLALGLALVGVGAVLVLGAGRTRRPEGVHYR